MKNKLKPKIVSFNKIKKLWENELPVTVYIHSAFCKNICNFCIYKGGIPYSGHQELYSKYFNEYLPNQLNNYADIIAKRKVACIYFGGGTPNMEEDLANLGTVFDKVRDIPCTEKVIELHYGLPITDRTIETLAKEHFTTALICIQTFDSTKLKEENRPMYDNDLDYIIKQLHQKNISVGIDLIDFLDSEERIVSDIKYLTELENKPDEITILHEITPSDSNYMTAAVMSESVKKSLFDLASPFYKIHISSGNDSYTFVLNEKMDDYYKNFFTFRQYQIAVPDDDKGIIGIGSAKESGHRSYSRVGRYVYLENHDITKNKTTYQLYHMPSAQTCIQKALKKIKLDPIFYNGSYVKFRVCYVTPEFTKDFNPGWPHVIVEYKRK